MTWNIKPGKALGQATPDDWKDIEERGGWLPEQFRDKMIEIIEPRHKKEYDRWIENIWYRLINVADLLAILESLDEAAIFKEVAGLPMLSSPEAAYALSRIARAVYGECILLLHGLLYDNDSRSLTLDELETNIAHTWLKKAYQKHYQDDMKKVRHRHKQTKNKLRPSLDKLRNNYFAHRSKNEEDVKNTKLVGTKTLRRCFDIAIAYFNACAIGKDYLIPGNGRLPNEASKGMSEITAILIANGSFVNSVETHGEYYKVVGIKDDVKARLNELRVKYGKPSMK